MRFERVQNPVVPPLTSAHPSPAQNPKSGSSPTAAAPLGVEGTYWLLGITHKQAAASLPARHPSPGAEGRIRPSRCLPSQAACRTQAGGCTWDPQSLDKTHGLALSGASGHAILIAGTARGTVFSSFI